MNEWIEWNGGECPVSNETRVQIMYRCETKDEFDDYVSDAGGYNWLHCESPYDIVAYRVVS